MVSTFCDRLKKLCLRLGHRVGLPLSCKSFIILSFTLRAAVHADDSIYCEEGFKNHFLKSTVLFLFISALPCLSRCTDSSLAVVHGLLTAAAPLVSEHRLWGTQAPALGAPGPWSAGAVLMVHGLGCCTACGIFLDQGLDPHCLHWQVDSSPLSYQGSPRVAFLLCGFPVVPELFIVGEGNVGGGCICRNIGLGEQGEQVGASFPLISRALVLGPLSHDVFLLDLGPKGLSSHYPLSEAHARGCSRVLIEAAPAPPMLEPDCSKL